MLRKRNAQVLAFLLLALSFCCFPACSQDKSIAEIGANPVSPSFDVLLDSCQGTVFFSPALTPGFNSDFPDYDLAVDVDVSSANLNQECDCDSTIVCLEISVDMPLVFVVALANSDDPSQITQIYSSSSGFDLDSRSLNTRYLHRILGTSRTNDFSFCFNANHGNTLLFDFQSGMTGAVNLTSANLNAGGFCILENVDNPSGTGNVRR